MIGLCRAEVDQDLKIQKMEMYHDLPSFLKVLEGEMPASELRGGKAILGDVGQPFVDKNK